jgi:chromosome segregation ATPase
VDYENIELQILLDEMEQQQEISRRLHEEHQELQRRLQSDKLRYEKARNTFSDYSQSQQDMLERQRATLETEQQRQEANSQKEENRLQQSLDLLREKNTKLNEQKQVLQGKLDQLKATMLPRGGKNTRKSKSNIA